MRLASMSCWVISTFFCGCRSSSWNAPPRSSVKSPWAVWNLETLFRSPPMRRLSWRVQLRSERNSWETGAVHAELKVLVLASVIHRLLVRSTQGLPAGR
ncbi:hypothetical protein D3C79_798970 [compost metagenome]